jgi:hypothetical protein
MNNPSDQHSSQQYAATFKLWLNSLVTHAGYQARQVMGIFRNAQHERSHQVAQREWRLLNKQQQAATRNQIDL